VRIDEPRQQRAAGKIDDLGIARLEARQRASRRQPHSTWPPLIASAEATGAPGSGRIVPPRKNDIGAFVRREGGAAPTALSTEAAPTE